MCVVFVIICHSLKNERMFGERFVFVLCVCVVVVVVVVVLLCVLFAHF